MATSFVPEFQADGYILSSHLREVAAVTSEERVAVAVARLETPGPPLFQTTLYPFEGRVAVFDLSSVIEADLRAHRASVAKYVLSVADAAATLNVVYCEYSAPALDIGSRFLTTVPARMVPPGGEFYLAAVPNFGPLVCYCVMLMPDGEPRTVTLTRQGSPFLSGATKGSMAELRAEALAAVGDPGAELLSVNFRNGDRSATYHVVPDAAAVSFLFRNAFNAAERVDIPGVVTEKTAVECQEAVCAGTAALYDRRVRVTYGLQSAPLDAALAELVPQLVASRELFVLDGDEWLPALVTDHTCEMSDNDEELWDVKLSWRLASELPRLNHRDTAGLRRAAGVFTDQFTDQFA